MNCPVCQNKLTATLYNYMPELRCNRSLDISGIWEDTHYHKSMYGYSMGQSYYIEQVIIMPYKITNHFVNHDMKKPYCLIEKYDPPVPEKPKDRLKLKEVLTLPYILEIKPYRKMQERIKSILIFS